MNRITRIKQVVCLAFFVFALVAFSGLGIPPVTASPAHDGGGVGKINCITMSEATAPTNELAFPDAVERNEVKPATQAEVESLQSAWLNSEREYTEIIKPFYERRSMLIEAMQSVIPIGHHWQDPATRLVFQTEVPNGKMVTFEHFGVKRTALEGESGSGKLAKKTAIELGYEL